MKKIKLITLSLTVFFAVNLNALNLDEAVNISLKNNFDIQGKNYDYLESLENVKANKSAFLPTKDVPSKIISPELGFSIKLRHLSNVDLPLPEGPTIEIISPFETLKLISLRTTLLPNFFFNFLTSSIR